jgi:hypothetical protein
VLQIFLPIIKDPTVRNLIIAVVVLCPTLATAQPAPPPAPQPAVQELDTQIACYYAGLAYSEGATILGANSQVWLCLRPNGFQNGQLLPMQWVPNPLKESPTRYP